MTASFSSLPRQWKRPSPAPGAALRKFFVRGAGPARSAPPVRPSAQPFSPPPRSTDGAHIDRSGTQVAQVAQAAAGKPSTNARPTEMRYEATRLRNSTVYAALKRPHLTHRTSLGRDYSPGLTWFDTKQG